MKPGRNDSCPCGSGKKYKKCCLDSVPRTRAAAEPPASSVVESKAEPIRKTKSRRVVLQAPFRPSSDAELVRDLEVGGYLGKYKTHPVVRITGERVDYGVKPQAGDQVGYGMDPYRSDDCFQAAIATATQVSIEQVPDLAIDSRLALGEDPEELNRMAWERIDQWAGKRGLTMRFWDDVPVPRERWVGVVGVETDETTFGDHCLVMAHDRLLFDPMCSVKWGLRGRPKGYEATEITYGISFDRQERPNASKLS